MKPILAPLALACLIAFDASAASVDWGVHDSVEATAQITPIGSFTDTYRFSLDRISVLYVAIGSHNVADLLQLKDSFVSFIDESTDTTLVRFSDWSYNSASMLWVGHFEPGTYRYEVTGIGMGLAGGNYFLVSQPQLPAIPEPTSLAMLLAGLGLVGFSGARRARQR